VTNLLDSGPGSLRQAILDTPAGGTVDFEPGLTGTIALTSGELVIDKDLTTAGPGAEVITVSGNHASRVFTIAALFTVDISGLTIADGMATNSNGGGILNGGTLSLTDCLVSGNSATIAFPNGGGGIYNSGRLTVTDSTLGNNSANGGGGIHNAPGGTVMLSACTLRENTAFYGGGIDNIDGRAKLSAGTLSGNAATEGGGIYTVGGRLALSACTLSGNTASGNTAYGGGLFNALGRLALRACTLSGNTATGNYAYGGGIYTASRRGDNVTTLSACTLSGNTASGGTIGDGGGIYNRGRLTISNCVLTGNVATATRASGGAIFTDGHRVTLSACTLSGNAASGIAGGGGGGLYIHHGRVTLSACTLSGNAASGDFGIGGALYNASYHRRPVTLSGCTVSDNTASTSGGGLYFPRRMLVLRNTILARNTAPSAPDLSGTLTSSGHNLIGDGTGGSGYADTDLVGTADNPVDPLLGPLQDNGGPTQTMALLAGSPAIGAGDPTDAPPTDQRGAPRIFHGTIDIGAYEVQAAPSPISSVSESLLRPHSHRLVNVGFGVQLNQDADPSTRLQVQVYGNDGAGASDARDIGPDTLRLRAKRSAQGLGRVYLIVATASDASGRTAFDLSTVVVPLHRTARDEAIVQVQALLAEVWYRLYHTAPPGYQLLGEGPGGGGGAPAPGQSGRRDLSADLIGFAFSAPLSPRTSLHDGLPRGVDNAALPVGHLLAVRASPPVDGYFATAKKDGVGLTLTRLDQGGWREANSRALDLVVENDWLVT
jgi:hypothetical protein